MADETNVKDSPEVQGLGFGDELLDLLHKAEVKTGELLAAVKTTGGAAVEALKSIFGKLLGK